MNTNNTLMQRCHNAVPRGVGQIHPIFAERAENCRVWDVEGREYLDFAGGIAVLNTGHLHPGIVSAVEAQLKKLSHTCFQVLAYEPYLALCERMNQKVPGDFAKKTLLVTTGSEAVENAVKIARAATKRSGAIAFSGAYHGRTHYTLSLTGKVHPYSAGMGLMPGHVYRALYPCPLHNISDDDAIASIERIFKNDAAPEDIAAIIIEPVQGEGGFYAASPAFMQRLRALCDQHGIMLIADEVQSGAGRTGTLFAMEQMGVAADITTFAKSIAGGFPLAGVTGRADVMDAIAPGGLGGTYAGNPIACVAALAVLLAYLFAGLLVVMIMRMLAEMAVATPDTGSFSTYADKAIGPWAGYTIGWLYWWFWVLVIPLEANIAAIILNSWIPGIPVWLFSLVITLALTGSNLLSVKNYGEFEFWLALSKVIAILAFIALGAAAISGFYPYAEVSGISRLWDHGGFMPNGFGAVLSAMLITMFSFMGAEIVTIAAAESDTPDKHIVRATNSVIW